MVHYALKAEGLPKDQRYALYGRWMDGSSKEAARGIRIDEAGNLLDDKGEPVTLSLGQMFPGEYVTIALVSEDGKAKAFGEITCTRSRPREKAVVASRSVPWTRGARSSPSSAPVRAEQEAEDREHSVNEVMHDTKNAGSDGTLPKAVILPAVVGRTGGDASYEVSDSDCSVKVLYKWGDEMRGKSAVARQPTP